MTFNEYQETAKTTAMYLEKVRAKYGDTIPEEIYDLLALSYVSNGLGEVGEVQGKVKKLIRDSAGDVDDEKAKAIALELGDILWYVASMATELGIELDDIAQANADKLKSRKERGVLAGSGDNR